MAEPLASSSPPGRPEPHLSPRLRPLVDYVVTEVLGQLGVEADRRVLEAAATHALAAAAGASDPDAAGFTGQVIPQLRRAVRAAAVGAIRPAAAGLAPQGDGIDGGDADEWASILADGLTGLPPRCAELLRVLYLEQRDEAEVAANLGIEVAEVDARRREALLLLGSALDARRPAPLQATTAHLGARSAWADHLARTPAARRLAAGL